jgi:hypothetical protein
MNGVPDLDQFLRDPDTRRLLELMKAEAGREIVIAMDDEPVRELLGRLSTPADELALIAIPRLRWGFVLVSLNRLSSSETGGEPLQYSDDTSIGMLYDTIAYRPDDEQQAR